MTLLAVCFLEVLQIAIHTDSLQIHLVNPADMFMVCLLHVYDVLRCE